MHSLKQLLPFIILMESGEGIIAKHPSYIMEKYISSCNLPDSFQLLDGNNLRKLYTWLIRWGLDQEGLFSEEELKEIRLGLGLTTTGEKNA